MCRLLTLGLLLVLLGSAAPAQAQGGSEEKAPRDLWNEYPVEPTPSVPAERLGEAESGSGTPASKGGDGGSSTIASAALALLAIAAVMAGAAAIKMRRPRPPGAVLARLRRRLPASGAVGGWRPRLPGRAAFARLRPRLPAPAASRKGRQRDASRAAPARPRRDRPGPTGREHRGRSAEAARHARAWVVPVQPSEPAARSKQCALGYMAFADAHEAKGPSASFQRGTIEAACKERGIVLHKLVGEIESRSSGELSRPGLAYALEGLATHEFTCLVVASLDRLVSNTASLGMLMRLLEGRDARLVVVDMGLDSRTREGRVVAQALAVAGGRASRTSQQSTAGGGEAPRNPRRSPPRRTSRRREGRSGAARGAGPEPPFRR